MAKSAIATEYIQLVASADGIGESINDAVKGVGGSAGSAFSAGFGSVMGNVAFKAAQATGAALKDFAASTLEVGKEFDASMSQVAATLGFSVDDLRTEGSEAQQIYSQLSEFAQEMGRTTKFTATEAADALNYMALAGYDADTSIEMLPNVLNLAAAGTMDLAKASDMITDSQTAFGISLDRTSQMVDEMAKAASTGNTSVEQLGNAFLTVGGLARELNGGMIELSDGTSLELDGVQELEVALTAMANAGIKGSEAGTHMRNMLLKLSDPTDAGVKALEKMGVAIYDEKGNMESLTNIMGGLSDAMSEMTQQEKISAITDLFNTRDTASAEAIMAALSDTIVKCGDNVYSLAEAQEKFGDAIYDSSQGYEIIENDWNNIASAITDADNAAENMAGTQLDNLAGDLTLFNSALDGAKLAISNDVTPTLRDFVRFGTDGISRLTAAFKEDGLGGAMDELGNVISEGLALSLEKASEISDAAFSLVTSLTEAVMQNLPMIAQTGMTILMSLVSGLTENTSIVPMLVQTLVSVAQILVDNLPTLLSAVNELVRQLADSILQDGLPILLAALPSLIDGIIGFIVGGIPLIINTSFQILEALVGFMPEIISALVGIIPQIIVSLITGIMENAPALIETILRLQYELVALAPMLIVELVKAVPLIIKGIVDAVKINWPRMKQAAIDLFNQFMEGPSDSSFLGSMALKVGEFFYNVIGEITAWFEPLKEEFISGLVVMIDGFKEVGSSIAEAVEEFFRPAVETIVSIWNWFSETFGPLLDAFANLFSAVLEAIQAVANQIWTAISNRIMEIWNGIVSFLTPIVESVKETVRAGFEFIKEKIFTPLQAVWEKVQEVWQNIQTKFTEVITAVHDFVAEKFELIRSKIEEPLQNAQNKVTEIFNGIKNTIMGVVNDALQWGKDLVGNFIKGITENIPSLTDAVNGMANGISERTHFSKPDKGPLADFDTYAPDMMKLFAEGIRDNENLITDQIDRSFNFGRMIALDSRPASAQPALAGAGAEGLTFVLPVYIGNEKLEEYIVHAGQAQIYRSGGR